MSNVSYSLDSKVSHIQNAKETMTEQRDHIVYILCDLKASNKDSLKISKPYYSRHWGKKPLQ